MEEEKVYPGKELPEEPAPPEPKPEEMPEEPEEEPKEDPKPEEKPEPEKDKETPKETEPLPKKRSIYDDLKDKKKEVKDAKAEAEAARKEADDAKAEATKLQGLLDAKDDAKTPKEKAKADDDIQAFIDKHNGEQLTAESLTELAQIIAGRVKPGDLPEDVREKLKFLDTLQADQKRLTEDAETRKSALIVKKTLEISDDAELETVMNEIVRLTHTNEFHDKEVEYILWKNREAFSKLVSPKKPSFESGDTKPDGDGDAEIDFSKPITPEQAQKATQGRGRPGGVDIVKPK
jgi:hypothetical protein